MSRHVSGTDENQDDAGWANYTWLLEAHLPAVLDAGLKRSGHFLLSCLGRRLPVSFWRGHARPAGRPATLLVAGADPWIAYLPNRFFADTPQRELVAEIPLWKLPPLIQRLQPLADLTIARVDRVSARLLFDEQYLAVPEWIGSVLSLAGAAGSGKGGSLKEDMRRIRRYRLVPVISHDEADFDVFYHTMYLPYTRLRYGPLAFLHEPRLLRRWFRRGGILWVQCDTQRIAGLLFTLSHGTFHPQVLGTASGEQEALQKGAHAAIYLYGIELARRHGCHQVEFGGSRPSLHDGVLRVKAKWSATLHDRRNTYFDLLVRWDRFNSAIADFLSHTSLIFRENGGLSAIHALGIDRPATQADALEACHALWIDGLRQLYLVSPTGWLEDRPTLPHTTLLAHDAENPCTPAALAKRLRSERRQCC